MKKKFTRQELAAVKFVASHLSASLLKKHKGVAAKDFNKCAKSQETLQILTALAASKAPKSLRKKHDQARVGVAGLEKALPMLKLAFGEAKIVAALPKQAGSDAVIKLCEHMGAPKTADLCRKKKNAPGKK